MVSGRELEGRYEAVLGERGTMRLAGALQRHRSHLHRIWAGIRPVPDELVAIVELLEALPPDRWPKRWAKIGEQP